MMTYARILVNSISNFFAACFLNGTVANDEMTVLIEVSTNQHKKYLFKLTHRYIDLYIDLCSICLSVCLLCVCLFVRRSYSPWHCDQHWQVSYKMEAHSL